MALIALPTWWNVGRVVFLAKNSGFLGTHPSLSHQVSETGVKGLIQRGSGWQQDLTSRQAGDQLAGPGQRTAPQAADRARSPSVWSPAWFSGRCCFSPLPALVYLAWEKFWAGTKAAQLPRAQATVGP